MAASAAATIASETATNYTWGEDTDNNDLFASDVEADQAEDESVIQDK